MTPFTVRRARSTARLKVTSPEMPQTPASPARLQRSVFELAFGWFTSPKLAIALLVAALGCCLVGAALLPPERAWALIYTALWFNALLVLLALSAGAAFFSRIWRRRITTVSVGMILFHLSFTALLGGIVYNSLFRFYGMLRLTEGETLPNGMVESYDVLERGRFFDPATLGGETTLLRMHPKFKVDGKEKRAAYEIAVGEGDQKTTGVIYITHDLVHRGVRYISSKEGYSVLVVMLDAEGREVYGAHLPLQSLLQPDRSFIYTTGSAHGAIPFPFPPPPEKAQADLIVTYRPSSVEERKGEVFFDVFSLAPDMQKGPQTPERSGRVAIGAPFDAGGFQLVPKEIRYWVGMEVRYDPGLPIILTSLCTGLAGMVLTFVGRMRQGSSKLRRDDGPTAARGSAVAAREEVA